MRCEHNQTPEQLWTSGLQGIANPTSHISAEVFEHVDEVSHKLNDYVFDTNTVKLQSYERQN